MLENLNTKQRHSLTHFFREKVFLSPICFGKTPSTFFEVCINKFGFCVIVESSLLFNTARALKTHTEVFTNVSLWVLTNYANLRHISVKSTTIHLSTPALFCVVVEKNICRHLSTCSYGNDYPWEDIVIKEVLKLRSIADLGTSDGILFYQDIREWSKTKFCRCLPTFEIIFPVDFQESREDVACDDHVGLLVVHSQAVHGQVLRQQCLETEQYRSHK